MPCYTRTKVTADMKVADLTALKAAFERIGPTLAYNLESRYISGYGITYQNGTVTASRQSDINQLKRYYAEAVIEQKAKKYGFQFRTNDNKTFQLIRR